MPHSRGNGRDPPPPFHSRGTVHSYLTPMEIVRHQREDHLELAVEGRLDGYWAQHLTSIVGEVMREGTHAVRLNLERTNYISSAGIGVLVELHRQFSAGNGSFALNNP